MSSLVGGNTRVVTLLLCDCDCYIGETRRHGGPVTAQIPAQDACRPPDLSGNQQPLESLVLALNRTFCSTIPRDSCCYPFSFHHWKLID
jgi:hypothetical protein